MQQRVESLATCVLWNIAPYLAAAINPKRTPLSDQSNTMEPPQAKHVSFTPRKLHFSRGQGTVFNQLYPTIPYQTSSPTSLA